MSEGSSPEDVVTVVRLLSLGRNEQADVNAGVITSMERASMAGEGHAVFLVTRDASVLRRLKVGDIVHWVPERCGIVGTTERRAVAAGGDVVS
jgi:hypothetical protein